VLEQSSSNGVASSSDSQSVTVILEVSYIAHAACNSMTDDSKQGEVPDPLA